MSDKKPLRTIHIPTIITVNHYTFQRFHSSQRLRPILVLFLGINLMTDHPNANAASKSSEAATLIRAIGKSTHWKPIGEIRIQFQTYHPQGMLKIGDRFYFTSVKRGQQRDEGEGYLFQTDLQGKLIKQLHLERGSIYHPGGIDTDGRSIWVPVAEYRPNSTSIVYEVDPTRMEARLATPEPFTDHIGAVICQPETQTIHGVNWGSRVFYRWTIGDNGELEFIEDSAIKNPNHFVDYQDGHRVDRDTMLCSGLNGYEFPTAQGGQSQTFELGGLGLIAFDSLRQDHLAPVPLWADPSTVMTRNPFFFEVVDGHLRFYFMPEDDESVIYIYDVEN